MIVLLKTTGYFVSVISVLLLGAAAWRTASDDPVVLMCLAGGMLLSMVGMLLRWISHLQDQREKDRMAGGSTPSHHGKPQFGR